MSKVSVIIPVYNGMQYLRECLDSVCGQTLHDIEILCIDDGSTDDSYRILEEYRDRDVRIKLFQQSNQYAGVARNKGMDEAEGEYLAFWDCDDFFEKDCLERMYAKASEWKADICVCGGNQYYTDSKSLVPNPRYLVRSMLPEKESFCSKDIPDTILNFTSIPAWNKIYRSEFARQTGLRFGGIRIGEDVYFTVRALETARAIVTVPERLVNYRTAQGTSLVDHMEENASDVVEIWMKTADDLIERGCFSERSFANRSLESMLFLLQHISDWNIFQDTVSLLKQSGIARMHIIEASGYYHNPKHQLFAEHLIHDTSEQLLMYLCHANGIAARQLRVDKRLLNQRYKKRGRTIKRLEAEKKNLEDDVTALTEERDYLKNRHFWQSRHYKRQGE